MFIDTISADVDQFTTIKNITIAKTSNIYLDAVGLHFCYPNSLYKNMKMIPLEVFNMINLNIFFVNIKIKSAPTRVVNLRNISRFEVPCKFLPRVIFHSPKLTYVRIWGESYVSIYGKCEKYCYSRVYKSPFRMSAIDSQQIID